MSTSILPLVSRRLCYGWNVVLLQVAALFVLKTTLQAVRKVLTMALSMFTRAIIIFNSRQYPHVTSASSP